jgi:hypothetical protein
MTTVEVIDDGSTVVIDVVGDAPAPAVDLVATPTPVVDVFSGTPGPPGEPGADSTVPGPQGPQGIQGIPGDAEEWHSAAGAPATGLGKVGDHYLNTTTGIVFEKTTDTTWLMKGNIKGPTGPAGAAGADAQWDSMTQAEYDALPVKDPNTLYVIVP